MTSMAMPVAVYLIFHCRAALDMKLQSRSTCWRLRFYKGILETDVILVTHGSQAFRLI